MTALPPVWLLDIDGVINAISRKPDPNVWPRDAWATGTATAAGHAWPILAARPVLELIRAVHDAGRAEIRWHTTWQHDAANLAHLLGLPDFPVQHCPGFTAHQQDVAGAVPTALNGVWWKLPAAERVVGEEGRALLWTDDDARWPELRDSAAAALGRLVPALVLAPQTHLGLTRKHLHRIDTFLDDPNRKDHRDRPAPRHHRRHRRHPRPAR
ncbi:hypothetical protein E1258_17650 [Micromonospora sp. KC207]|uniref:hypothetical protein n=1 Tax=Micromonospora sp. KC207 TaxID=2530377 RepID=UPI001048FBAB|nr:hypothetical protein [Micromonospora sp. KC207]TDC59556.1 hypothetical protein E1258_17650 [Micromonospora sp. KC207]